MNLPRSALALIVATLWIVFLSAQGATALSLFFSRVPAGLSVLVPVPADNPLTAERVALGARLFFDTALSRDRTVACATCHRPDRAFTDGRPVAIGIGGRRGRRNAPTLLNRAYGREMFWDSRAGSLEEQALAPMINPTELGNTHEEIVRRLDASTTYRRLFRLAFGGGEVTIDRAAQAIANFERTLLSGDSPVDRDERHDNRSALTAPARRGRNLFVGKANCIVCHNGPTFSDERLHNTGVGWGREPVDLGRYEVTLLDEDRGRFKTPTLRDVARTPPYMHDGSVPTLRAVVEFYDRGGTANPYLDARIKPLGLSPSEKTDLVAFLKSLTGRR